MSWFDIRRKQAIANNVPYLYNGLEHYFNFNDNTNDSVGYLVPTVTGTTYVSSVEDKAINCNGTTDLIEFNDFLGGRTEASISFLFKASSATSFLNNWSIPQNLLTRINAGQIQVAVSVGSVEYISSFFPFSDYGNWNHLTVTYDNSSVKVYLNGVKSATEISVSGGFDAGTSLVFGEDHFGFKAGSFDCLGLWSKTLTDSQVLANYNIEINGMPLV